MAACTKFGVDFLECAESSRAADGRKVVKTITGTPLLPPTDTKKGPKRWLETCLLRIHENDEHVGHCRYEHASSQSCGR